MPVTNPVVANLPAGVHQHLISPSPTPVALPAIGVLAVGPDILIPIDLYTQASGRCPRRVCSRRNPDKNLAANPVRIPQNLAGPERFGEGAGKVTRNFLKKPIQRILHPATLATTGQAAFTGHYFCDTKIMSERAVMEEIVIRAHAFKHGLSREQIVHAWRNAVDARQRLRDDGGLDVVVIGPDERGRMLEVIAHVGDGPAVIFHANTPPSKRALREFHIVEGGRK